MFYIYLSTVMGYLYFATFQLFLKQTSAEWKSKSKAHNSRQNEPKTNFVTTWKECWRETSFWVFKKDLKIVNVEVDLMLVDFKKRASESRPASLAASGLQSVLRNLQQQLVGWPSHAEWGLRMKRVKREIDWKQTEIKQNLKNQMYKMQFAAFCKLLQLFFFSIIMTVEFEDNKDWKSVEV